MALSERDEHRGADERGYRMLRIGQIGAGDGLQRDVDLICMRSLNGLGKVATKHLLLAAELLADLDELDPCLAEDDHLVHGGSMWLRQAECRSVFNLLEEDLLW